MKRSLPWGLPSAWAEAPEGRSKDRVSAWLQGAGIFLLVIFSLFQSWALAAPEAGGRYIDEALQLELADQFLNDADYYGAIREYKRFLFFFPRSARAEEALLKIARSYFKTKKWDETIAACDDLVKKLPASSLKAEAHLLKGDALAEKKEYSQARVSFREAQELSPGSLVADQAQLQIARTYLKEEKWEEAANEFRKVDKNSKLYPKGESFAQGLDRIQEVPQKSPVAAGIMSAILPGAGQVYSERYGEGAISFLLNGAFIAGMIVSFANQEYVVGGILTVFELGWYSANIVNAVAGAHKYNRQKRMEYLDDLERGSNLSFRFSWQGKTPVLSLHYAF